MVLRLNSNATEWRLAPYAVRLSLMLPRMQKARRPSFVRVLAKSGYTVGVPVSTKTVMPS